MTTFFDGKIKLHIGDCLDVLAILPDNSVDACVTDPPYHLTSSIVNRFGGDNAAPSPKSNLERDDSNLQLPSNRGGGGTTSPYQRVSTGFMGQKWDGGDIAFRPELWREVARVLKPGAHLLAFGGTRTYHRMACAIEDAGFEIRDCIQWLYGSGFPKSHNQGNGWGTALKPACEPIVLARKPLSEKTIAANVLKWGTGAINVGKCRVKTENPRPARDATAKVTPSWFPGTYSGSRADGVTMQGRWPANVIHDGSAEVVAGFPENAPSGGVTHQPKRTGYSGFNNERDNGTHIQREPDSGSAARYFYTAKADADDRIGSRHPTVKPLDLMQYLVRLITPKGGLVLDPFAGTGTTGEAAFREGMHAILIEREAEYQADIRRRMELCMAGPDERMWQSMKAKLADKPRDDGPLFGGDPSSLAVASEKITSTTPNQSVAPKNFSA